MSGAGPSDSRWTWVYRAVLFLYPPSFRRRFGERMLEDARELARSERVRGRATARVVVRLWLDVLRSAPREWWQLLGGDDPSLPPRREAWGVRGLEETLRDVRVGLRRMARSPAFTGVTSVTLAIGIGGTVALFSVVHGLLLRPLPFADDERLVVFWQDWNWRGVEFDFVKSRAGEYAGVYDGLAAYTLEGATLGLGSESIPVTVGLASAELFDVLDATPFLGRTFRPGEDRPGAPPVVVLSHALWRQLGGVDAVLGRSLLLDGVPTTVVGVMPPGFYFPVPDAGAWRPLLLDPASPVYQGRGWLVLLGRLARGVSEPEVRADLGGLAAALGERFTYPEAWDKTRDPTVQPLRTYLLGDARRVVLLLLGAVGLLFLMATANAAALILARTSDRTSEMEVRASLGAGRGRLVRQVLTESLLLALVAGMLGAVLAVLSFEWLVARLPLQDGLDRTLRLGWPMLLCGMALSSLAGVLVALVPVRRLIAGSAETLRPGARTAAGGGRLAQRMPKALVAAEVAVAVLLTTGAMLLGRSVSRLHAVDVGLEPRGVGALDLIVGGPEELSNDEVEIFLSAALENVGALPGVASVALTLRLPLRGDDIQGSIVVEDRPELTGAQTPSAYWRPVTDEYFRTMGIRILAGRAFQSDDLTGEPDVAVVSARLAADMWPGDSPLGKRIRLSAFETVWATVVGVADDVPVHGVRAAPPHIVYRPDAQRPFTWRGHTLVFRTAGQPQALLPAVEEAVRRADPRVALARPTAMDEVVARSIGDVLQVRFFLGLLSLVALALGSVGVYGVVSYSVTRRTAEFGIRMAMGADRRRIVAGVLRAEAGPVILGVGFGLTASLPAARALSSVLWEVGPHDPLSLGLAAGMLLGVGLIAALLPAMRAGTVSPSVALRREA